MQVLLYQWIRCQKSLGEGEFKRYLVLHLTAIPTSTKLPPVCAGAVEERLTNGGYLKGGGKEERTFTQKNYS